jgi:ABC-type multidrug transport system fused ATPase/permease subunit
MAEELEEAVKAEDKKVALIIAILALFLAFAEAGAKYAQHRSTEKNLESSDLYNFYQAKRIRQSVEQTAEQWAEASRAAVPDDKAAAIDKQIEAWKADIARFDKDPKHPEDSLDQIQERAKGAAEARESLNRQLEHFEYASGALQIAIVLASASIITGMVALAWISGALGLIGGLIVIFGYFAPTWLPVLGG